MSTYLSKLFILSFIFPSLSYAVLTSPVMFLKKDQAGQVVAIKRSLSGLCDNQSEEAIKDTFNVRPMTRTASKQIEKLSSGSYYCAGQFVFTGSEAQTYSVFQCDVLTQNELDILCKGKAPVAVAPTGPFPYATVKAAEAVLKNLKSLASFTCEEFPQEIPSYAQYKAEVACKNLDTGKPFKVGLEFGQNAGVKLRIEFDRLISLAEFNYFSKVSVESFSGKWDERQILAANDFVSRDIVANPERGGTDYYGFDTGWVLKPNQFHAGYLYGRTMWILLDWWYF